ncbi:hypothetical protein [Nostoc sp.]|uniref:hypothetical protein n=1 Tax=Nostoc sp. TaxID=1180 RepID=UPI002FF4E60E
MNQAIALLNLSWLRGKHSYTRRASRLQIYYGGLGSAIAKNDIVILKVKRAPKPVKLKPKITICYCCLILVPAGIAGKFDWTYLSTQLVMVLTSIFPGASCYFFFVKNR